jgi:alpha-L-fucosidase
MFERDLPGQNSMGFNKADIAENFVLEMCETMNGSWGFNIIDQNYKSVKQLIHTMVKAAGYGSNFLLNTGPMPNGKIQPENVDTLLAIGNWLETYGESIYGTRSGPVKPADWGASTQKGNQVYLHILDYEENMLEISGMTAKVKSAKLFDDGSSVSYKQNKRSLVLSFPERRTDSIDTIVILELK